MRIKVAVPAFVLFLFLNTGKLHWIIWFFFFFNKLYHSFLPHYLQCL